MDKEILEGNFLIALFDGKTFGECAIADYKDFSADKLPKNITRKINYHLDWNLLMPVVEKIESAGLIVQIGHNSYCSIYGEFKEDAPWDGFHVSTDTDPIAGKVENKINGVWLCVVQFIQWYNSNQPQQ